MNSINFQRICATNPAKMKPELMNLYGHKQIATAQGNFKLNKTDDGEYQAYIRAETYNCIVWFEIGTEDDSRSFYAVAV